MAFRPTTGYPASTWIISPVTPPERSLNKKAAAPPASSRDMFFFKGELHSFHLKIYLKCDNLTNKYYQTVNGYATSPRAYYVGLNAKF